MEHTHVWKQLYKTDHRARSATATTTTVDWCEVCGSVQVHNSFHEIMEHITDTYTPRGVDNA